ncbi:MAG: glycerophosphoryl diester phosphodiesterase membrane domain-containing protein, partial [Blastomonas sp.]|nr:glycerophosphoryl diester phosphodiesterase membrane domain-containing protein [Blastomonas sp.]
YGWIILIGLLNGFASIVMLLLMLDRRRPNVREAMRRGLSIILPYYAMGVLSGVLTFLGSLAFILPGIYIFVKLIVAGPVMAAERVHTIIAPMRRSWALTKGNSGRILIFVLVVAVTAFFVYITSVTVFGIVIRLALEGPIAETLTMLIDAVVSMLLSVLMVCVYAGIYRQLAEPDADEIAREFA